MKVYPCRLAKKDLSASYDIAKQKGARIKMGSIVKGFSFQGDPDFRTISNIKWRPLQREIDASLSDYGGLKRSGEASLQDWISKYLADTINAEKRTGEETGAIDRYYDGSLESQLLDIRNRRAKAIGEAATLGGKKAIQSMNLSRLGGDGGTSSYDTRNLMRTIGDINTGAAVDASNQERGDLGYLESGRLGLLGKRQDLADTLINRALAPEGMRRNIFNQNLGMLGNLQKLDAGNKFYGLQQKSTGIDRWANAADALGSLVALVGSMGATGAIGGAPAGTFTTADASYAPGTNMAAAGNSPWVSGTTSKGGASL